MHCLNEEKLCPLKKIEQLEALDLEADDIFEQVYDESQAATQLTFQVLMLSYFNILVLL